MKKRLFWQLFPSYLLIVLISLAMSIWYSSQALKQSYINQVETDLKARALLVEEQINKDFFPDNAKFIEELCKKLDQKVSMRITVILPDGKVIADSREQSDLMDNHKHRPEIVEAFAGNIGKSIRYSHTLKKDMMYVAVTLVKDNKPAGVVRTAIPLLFIEHMLGATYLKIIIGGLVIALITIFISFLVSKRISKPLEKLAHGAEQFARGNLKYNLSPSKTKEIDELIVAMNKMAVQLDDKMNKIVQQSNELEFILSGMVEGVIAIDTDEKIIKMNKAATIIIGTDISEAQGCRIQEVIRNPDLNKLISASLSTKTPVKEDIVFYNYGKECYIQAYSAGLHNKEGENIGALIVLNDITRTKKLENIRRDFVANVSHELKTPVTSIKGYAETLIDGAIDNKEETMYFTGIILKHADRLDSIIDDLLSLARLEQESEQKILQTDKCRIPDILESAMQLCSLKAESKNIKLELSAADDIQVMVDGSLIEQAVVNLIDNAVKYSEPESKVLVELFQNEEEIIIKVADKGCGIAKEHLPRLFERFYRVDKARSRKFDGTGLGLSIVKHISQLHGGYATVESELGAGSVFSIHIPINKAINLTNS